MYSGIQPGFLFTDVSSEITENDIDVVSDLWNMDGRSVYRGSRDPRYSHASVYWLYDEDLQRVGCSEHSNDDHAKFQILWFHESEFATLLQEPGWKIDGDIWSKLPQHVFEKFMNEGWTKPSSFLSQCLRGNMRIITPEMVIKLPIIHRCGYCGYTGLIPHTRAVSMLMDFPDKEKVFFVDDDLVVHIPSLHSSVWSKLRLHDGGSSREQAQEQEQLVSQTPPKSPEPHSPLQTPPQDPEQMPNTQEH
jgi:hypothetical protein